MKPFLLFIVLSMGLYACKQDSQERHIPPQKMQEILLDINIAEGYSIMVKDSLHNQGIKNDDSLALYYKDILAHHKVTPKEFSESMSWYLKNQDQLDTMYTNMIPVISKMQNELIKK